MYHFITGLQLKRKMNIVGPARRHSAIRHSTDVDRIVVLTFGENESRIQGSSFCLDTRTEAATQSLLAMKFVIEALNVLCPEMKETRNKIAWLTGMDNCQRNYLLDLGRQVLRRALVFGRKHF
jgi:hypothetical protein